MIHGLKPYPEYKASALSWVGTIPRHWDEKRAKYLFREVDERSKTGKEELLSVSHITGVTPRSQKNVTMFMAESTVGHKICRPGDLVINTLWAWMGALGVSQFTGLVSPAYGVYRPSETSPLASAFIGHLLRSPQYVSEYICRSTGIQSSRLRLYAEQLLEIPVVCPPPDEQRLILRYLAHVDRRIRRYVSAKKKLIALLNEQKQAIIHRAVTRGLDPNVRLKPSGVEWLGEVPAHWEIRRTKQGCIAIVDCKIRTPDMVPGGEFTVVRTTNVRNGRFNINGSYPTDRRNYEIWTQRGAPRPSDIFFTREAPAGEECLVPTLNNLCMGQRMMCFRPDSQVIDQAFFLQNIYGPLVRTYVEHVCNGSTVGHLRLGDVAALPLMWCPLAEQRAIVDYIAAATGPIDRAIDRARREIELLREYRARLIADVVTGKLDVREAAAHLPDEADASEPLDEADALTEDDDADPDATSEEAEG